MRFLISIFITKLENSIENYFSMLKSRLQKLEGLKYENLKENIKKVISEIPKEKYENIFRGVLMKDQINMFQKIKQEKLHLLTFAASQETLNIS